MWLHLAYGIVTELEIRWVRRSAATGVFYLAGLARPGSSLASSNILVFGSIRSPELYDACPCFIYSKLYSPWLTTSGDR
jgi:hypothetical protein